LAALVDHFSTLPGIGSKSALRIALHLINRSVEDAQGLAASIASIHQTVGFCTVCGCFSEHQQCAICNNDRRNRALLCVVEQPVDVLMIERSGFEGCYHVLHGRLSPIDGIGPEQLTLRSLQQRIASGKVEELVLATSATVDGEATAFYIARNIANEGLKVSRIARGVPDGGELEYIDEFTLSRALEQRTPW